MESKREVEAIESIDDSKKKRVEALLSDIQGALEKDPGIHESFFNEFGDFTIAIPLGGDQATKNACGIPKQESHTGLFRVKRVHGEPFRYCYRIARQ